MYWDDLPSRFRKRRSHFPRDWLFEDIDEVMKDMEKMMEETLKRFSDKAPKDLIREKTGPDGGKIKEMGPFVYGYSMKIGPDGKPEIREFGNIKPGLRPSGFSFKPRRNIDVKSEREPLIDVMSDKERVKVVIELPGVEKKDIKLDATPNSIIIDVDVENRKYYKELELPTEVDPKSAKSSYKNGVLEVNLSRLKEKPKGFPLEID